MEDEDESDARETVDEFVRAGFYDADRIFQIIDEEVFEPGVIDRDWLRREIDAAFLAKRLDEQAWPAVTDCDRLDRAFETLAAQGVVALHKAGNTQSDGFGDAMEVYNNAGGKASGVVGYCFYHGQDVECVLEIGDLFLAFGDINGNDDKGIKVGRQIQRTLEDFGFTVEWNGSVKTRVLVKNLNWQRRAAPPGWADLA